MAENKEDRNAKIFKKAVEDLELRFPVAMIAEAMDYKKPNISAFLNGKKSIPDNFLDNFFITFKLNKADYYKKLDNKREHELEILKKSNVIGVPLVGQYAYAGYMSGYMDNDYMESLPVIPFFAEHEAKGDYLAFEVRGDSMDNGTDEAIIEGDILICRKLDRRHWYNKLHIDQWDFVVVHPEDGILCKRIIYHNPDTGEIVLHSLNDYYKDKSYNISEFGQVFTIVQVVKKRRRK